MCLLSKWFPRLFLSALLMVFFLPAQVLALSIWDIGNGENMLEGLLLSCSEEYVLIGTKSGIKTLPLSGHPFAAMTGKSSGYVVNPTDFPPLIKVEIILDRHRKVRAMRNKQESIATPSGLDLHVSGHDVILSPDGEYYLLYHVASGLFLHSITNKYEPVFISKSPLAAWNPDGNKIACFYEDKFLIYDVLQHSRTLLSLSAVENGLVRVLTGLEWSPDGKKLMYTFLEDYPDLGSDVFYIRVIQIKPSRNIVNLAGHYKQQVVYQFVNRL